MVRALQARADHFISLVRRPASYGEGHRGEQCWLRTARDGTLYVAVERKENENIRHTPSPGPRRQTRAVRVKLSPEGPPVVSGFRRTFDLSRFAITAGVNYCSLEAQALLLDAITAYSVRYGTVHSMKDQYALIYCLCHKVSRDDETRSSTFSPSLVFSRLPCMPRIYFSSLQTACGGRQAMLYST